MKIIKAANIDESFYEYKEFPDFDSVREIIEKVKIGGDKCVIEYSSRFGDGEIKNLLLTQEEIETAIKTVSEEVKEAIKSAVENVRGFAQAQFECLKELELNKNGLRLGHRVIPLERIGAYVPGGNYPLPSSAIMSIIPAKVAGVKEVIVCSPKIKPETIAACHIAGADKIFRIGGIQAIAAMAYGTESVPAVDKITGPGNKYVTAAKKQVYGKCGIDFLAGPSEVMIIADESAKPELVAADMLAQLEHDRDTQACLITFSLNFADKVVNKINEFLNKLKTADIIKDSINNAVIILAENIDQAVEIANKKAPEHLEICFDGANSCSDSFINYGSLFIGNFSAEVYGDYCSGTNHVLPTCGIARYNGGLSVFDFVKIQTYQEISKEAAQKSLSPIASTLAKTEGLHAHKLSSDLRAL